MTTERLKMRGAAHSRSTKTSPVVKPRRMTQEERTALSDTRMYEAATRLICEKGGQNTTLREIGELAGYSRGLASGRFGSKEALYRDLLTFLNKKWVAKLEVYVDGRTGLNAFCATLDAAEHFLQEQSDYTKAMYVLWYESIGSHDEVRKQLSRQQILQRNDVERCITEGIRQGDIKSSVNPMRLAMQYCSFIYGTIYQWLVSPETCDLRTAFGDYKDSALALIANDAAQVKKLSARGKGR